MKYLASIILVFWGVLSLYFGIGGSLKTENYNEINKNYDFDDTVQVRHLPDNTVYKNYAELQLYKEDQKALKIFPWITFIPSFVGTIITACFFGMLGAVISLLKDVALRNEKVEDVSYISIPLLGFLTGIVVLGLNYIIPIVLVAGENDIRPITLLFFSLFAGLFSPQFYNYLSNSTSKIFKDEK